MPRARAQTTMKSAQSQEETLTGEAATCLQLYLTPLDGAVGGWRGVGSVAVGRAVLGFCRMLHEDPSVLVLF